MAILIAPGVLEKLADKHGVSKEEVEECFLNRTGPSLVDDREEHAQDPPSQWFISETDRGRVLKVVFYRDADINIRTAYEPSPAAMRVYQREVERRKQ